MPVYLDDIPRCLDVDDNGTPCMSYRCSPCADLLDAMTGEPENLVRGNQPAGWKLAMSFSEALMSMKEGCLIAREGWNGKGMWLKLVPGYRGDGVSPGGSREHLPWIGMRTADNKFVPWLASQTDILATDWTIPVRNSGV